MKNGNFTNAVMKRSVFSIAGNKNNKERPCIGSDCVAYDGAERLVSSIASGEYAIYRAVTKVNAKGADAASVTLSVRIPKSYEEGHVKECIRSLRKQCDCLGVDITGVEVCGDDRVTEPLITAACTGFISSSYKPVIEPEQNIAVVQPIGLEGARILGKANKDRLCSYFTQLFYEKAMGSEQDLNLTRVCKLCTDKNLFMLPLGEGGIFAGLWNMAEYGKVGLSVDLKKIPVRQEIIEICELLEKNIYELSSFGSLLMTFDDKCDIINFLKDFNVEFSIIGRTTPSNDKIIYNDDEVRYLDTPKRDAIYN